MSSDWAQSPVDWVHIPARIYFILASGWIWTDWDRTSKYTQDLAGPFLFFLPLLSHLRAAMAWLREKLESELKFHLQLWQATSCSNVRELLWKAAIWVSPWLVNVWLAQVKTWLHSPALKIMALTGWVHQPRLHQLCSLHPIASPCASSSASTLRRLHEKVRKSNRPSVQHPENQEKIQMTRSPGRRCGWIQ